ncbi:MAG: zf-HC2 domain-containing protein, partial [Actinomycetota bacterium]|nr:zf-HC2 domain-containing protein [Actinomycetota bacterium]
MTPPPAWHPGEELLQSYVDGGLPGLSASSVEAHLLACGTCRTQLTEAVEPTRLIRLRLDIDDRIDAAQRPWSERLLVRCGLDEADARALLAAPSLRWAWWLAVAAAVALGLIVAGDTHDPDALFLVVAPIVPLAATAAAYAPALDPAFSLVAATPYRTMRLLLARSIAVGATAMVGVAGAALA